MVGGKEYGMTQEISKNYISKKILTNDMNITTITISSKGQIAIPQQIRNAANIKEGDTLLLVEQNGKILLQHTEIITDFAKEDIKAMSKLQEASLRKIWDNDQDEKWSKVLARRYSTNKLPVHKPSRAKSKTGNNNLKQ